MGKSKKKEEDFELGEFMQKNGTTFVFKNEEGGMIAFSAHDVEELSRVFSLVLFHCSAARNLLEANEKNFVAKTESEENAEA